MRSERTSGSHENIVVLSDIRREKSIASSPYGPVRAGLTTLRRTQEDHQLTELLSSLESTVATLNYKSSTVLNTLESATEAVRVALLPSTTDEVGTDETP